MTLQKLHDTTTHTYYYTWFTPAHSDQVLIRKLRFKDGKLALCLPNKALQDLIYR